MRFKRFLAMLLLLILPLQASLAAIDSCCDGSRDAQVELVQAVAADLSADSGEESCCTQCDFCHHSSMNYAAAIAAPLARVQPAAPVPHPEPPIDSFIPDVPSRPDRV